MKGPRQDSARDYDIPGLRVVDPEDRGLGTQCYACDGWCAGHYTGKLTAVEDASGEIRHYATTEAAAKRWARKHGAKR